jgi:hypothetical protein
MSLRVSATGTERAVPVIADSRVSYAPVEQTRSTYSVPLTKPKK